jgi:hypothetical protein
LPALEKAIEEAGKALAMAMADPERRKARGKDMEQAKEDLAVVKQELRCHDVRFSCCWSNAIEAVMFSIDNVE